MYCFFIAFVNEGCLWLVENSVYIKFVKQNLASGWEVISQCLRIERHIGIQRRKRCIRSIDICTCSLETGDLIQHYMQSFVQDLLIIMSNEEIFIQDFLVILKKSLKLFPLRRVWPIRWTFRALKIRLRFIHLVYINEKN